MHYVYLIESANDLNQRYVGSTSNLNARLKAHNAGQSPHTAKFKPWKLISYHAFETKEKAEAFELYLKSGSGRAFASKRSGAF